MKEVEVPVPGSSSLTTSSSASAFPFPFFAFSFSCLFLLSPSTGGAEREPIRRPRPRISSHKADEYGNGLIEEGERCLYARNESEAARMPRPIYMIRNLKRDRSYSWRGFLRLGLYLVFGI